MSKKLYAAFLPLLAVVVLAATAAGASAAEPHWYSTNLTTHVKTRLEFEKGGKLTKVPVTTHSTPAGLSLEALGHKIICTVSDTGEIWNVNLATSGRDSILTFTNTGCSATPAICAAGETLELIAGSLPWKTKLIAGPRDEIEGIEIKIYCTLGTVKTPIDTFTGTLSQAIHNGTTGSAAGCTETPTDTYSEFDAKSGTLTDSLGNLATADGRDCIWGPAGDELITVESP